MRLSEILTGEGLVRQTTAQQRRIANWILFEFWLTGGMAIWVVLRSALWFVGFMSLYAILWGHVISWSAETPVEHEQEVDAN